MSPYLLLLHLAGAIALLLWAVRMVRTGVERSQEPLLKRVLRQSGGGRIRAAGIGAMNEPGATEAIARHRNEGQDSV